MKNVLVICILTKTRPAKSDSDCFWLPWIATYILTSTPSSWSFVRERTSVWPISKASWSLEYRNCKIWFRSRESIIFQGGDLSDADLFVVSVQFLSRPRDWEAPECYVTHQSDRFLFFSIRRNCICSNQILFPNTKTVFSLMLDQIFFFNKLFHSMNSAIIFSKRNILIR